MQPSNHQAKLPERAIWLNALLFTLLLAGAAILPVHADTAATTRPDSSAHAALEIRSAKGRLWFNISIADTAARQERGLMFVEQLPADTGMLFPQTTPRIMTMWMKNTLIPLDMIFIDRKGKIVCIRERAVPQSLNIISCDVPVKAVLEIGGGEALKRGITVGDTVVYSTFSQ